MAMTESVALSPREGGFSAAHLRALFDARFS
jgi:hypothetical protein